MKIKIKKSKLILIILTPLFFSFSYILLNNYIKGDQTNYIIFYESAANTSLKETWALAISRLDSYEPISIYTLWVGAKLGIDKNIYISIFNVILLSGIYLVLIKYKTPWYVIILVLTNFYIIVLMTGAERLKFSYILLTYGLLLDNKKKFLFILLSPLAHLQSFIILIVSMIENFFYTTLKMFSKFRLKKIDPISIIIVMFLAIITINFLQENIFRKTMIYSDSGRSISSKQYSELFNVIILLFIALLVAKNQLKVLLLILPMIVATYYLGSSRTNMISFSLVFYILLLENRLKHPYFLVILIYLSLKSIPFVRNIFLKNNGFDGFLF